MKVICEHGKEKRYCKEGKLLGTCGRDLCEHIQYKTQCLKCRALGLGGTSICEHNIKRYECVKCNGNGVCEHKRTRRTCVTCKGSATCIHNRQRRSCTLCYPKGVYQSYVYHEKKRFGKTLPENFMSLIEFCSVIKRNCCFCNRTPEEAKGMGVDRIDNNKRHVSGNLEACCKICNRMRMDMPREEFFWFCYTISKNHEKVTQNEIL
jgi:hypothetical protein